MAGSLTTSMNGTLSGATPKMIPCFRHEDGEPFALRKETGFNKPVTLVYTDVEAIITKRVKRMKRLVKKQAQATVLMKSFNNGGPNTQQIQQQAFICPRRDVTFLKCLDMSPDHNIRTILGIAEDNQCQRVEIVCYRAEECKRQQRIRMWNGPHSEWKRASFKNESHVSVDDEFRKSERTKMSWIDLRKFQRENQSVREGSFLSTEAGVVQFLRSILTSSHDSSPWKDATETIVDRGEKPKGKPNKSYLSSQEIVVLALNFVSNRACETDFSLLKKFRVSDAAPSWFLHGFVDLETLEHSMNEIFRQKFDQNYLDRPITAPTCASTLLIYKKLSPRRTLHVSIPASCYSKITGNTNIGTNTEDEEKIEERAKIVEKGCLWEEYKVQNTNDKSNHQDVGNETSNVIQHSKQMKEKKNRPCRLVSPPYLNLDEEYPGKKLSTKLFSKEALRIFTEDALSVPKWTPWPETAHYKVSSFGNEKPWTVFPLCHCFPGNDPDKFTWVPVTRSFVPRTCRLLEDALRFGDGESYLRTALFSQLAPRSVLQEHTGWADLANHVLRLHIPLVVPSNSDGICKNDDLCGTWVDGCVETHAVGRPLLFDDSKTHRAFNYSDGDRIVLIVDLARPGRLPLGTAESGHTEELDSFIDQMNVPK